ncbi:uncharacterized protein BO95DRAFT_430636 [Aspergillus brunneoviolaceus CBS 621.78]|uniref:Uncharacterized protein n=1 Tax=Aspergillus brunneoviolaceus CBS 621.78 TaxID=1450534 RepID=A0ACD1GCU9_9EURO|nr:hypothetical protein BO95DRAFT_430636 [Aspergillus brunneoviolaceus CBS 621.78]RAH47042.1 hypothetical protein BO95DRAFT_430636 [Aspergillus brunneoviolaceus CBS 621.78]
MTIESSSVAISTPRSRPRAATTVQPAPTFPASLSSRRSSQVMAPLTLSPTLNASAASPMPAAGDQETSRAAAVSEKSIVKEPRIERKAGPLRHPKPLTPSDIHSMLEQEQEAMVNRLSRELSLLRQQTASVASTTSSTSTTLNDPMDSLHASQYAISSTVPTTSRRHRSSSSLSSSYIPAVQGSRTGSGFGIAPSRETQLPSTRTDSGRSREPSLTSRQSDAALSQHHLPSTDQLSPSIGGFPYRNSITQQKSPVIPPSRHEELLAQREEVDMLKRENETLRRRVRELELIVRNSREQERATDHSIPDTARSGGEQGREILDSEN